ncbi:MAG: hypothetical protein C4332_07470 [Meiothermus sp.]
MIETSAQTSLGVVPSALLVGLFLGLFRLGLELTPGLSGALNFGNLVGEKVLWTFQTGFGNSISVGLGAFYASALTLCVLGAWVLRERRWQSIWLALTAIIAVPYFALPKLFGILEPSPLLKPLSYLHVLTLVTGEIALALTALPGLTLMVGLEAITAPLHGLGAVWAWGLWGAGFGFVLGLEEALSVLHQKQRKNQLLIVYVLVWGAVALTVR